MKEIVSPLLTLIEVANPWIVESPFPEICQSLSGSPGNAFSQATGLAHAADAAGATTRATARTVASNARNATNACLSPRDGLGHTPVRDCKVSTYARSHRLCGPGPPDDPFFILVAVRMKEARAVARLAHRTPSTSTSSDLPDAAWAGKVPLIA